jgi:hypothetical protein
MVCSVFLGAAVGGLLFGVSASNGASGDDALSMSGAWAVELAVRLPLGPAGAIGGLLVAEQVGKKDLGGWPLLAAIVVGFLADVAGMVFVDHVMGAAYGDWEVRRDLLCLCAAA